MHMKSHAPCARLRCTTGSTTSRHKHHLHSSCMILIWWLLPCASIATTMHLLLYVHGWAQTTCRSGVARQGRRQGLELRPHTPPRACTRAPKAYRHHKGNSVLLARIAHHTQGSHPFMVCCSCSTSCASLNQEMTATGEALQCSLRSFSNHGTPFRLTLSRSAVARVQGSIIDDGSACSASSPGLMLKAWMA